MRNIYIPIFEGSLWHFILPLTLALPAPCLGVTTHLLLIRNAISPQGHFLEHFYVLVSSTLMLFQKPCAIVIYFIQLYHCLPFSLTTQSTICWKHYSWSLACSALPPMCCPSGCLITLCLFIGSPFISTVIIEHLCVINPFLGKRDTKMNKTWFKVVQDMVPRGSGFKY